ncbi:protein kinase domain-containing protein [Chondromyces crocatus]|uniref:Uncharacterized protein n=1 Tax=Chondromyces crocatus TaxID=52 RepID=A0A0K1EC21_CHOCO|nr:protein kinase [Chondromyces crocatus]AKT38436.1 uncharacterized protein CMC5_025820 [Chondromyces crocatus]
MDGPVINVLLVEDNPADARLLREMVAEAVASDLVVTHVDRVALALKAIGEQCFDVVLLDLSLPDSFGFEGFVKIHTAAPTLPLVILSNLDDEALALRAVQEGAQDYLPKGRIKGPALVRAVRYAVERGRREAAQLASVVAQAGVTPVSAVVPSSGGRLVPAGGAVGQAQTVRATPRPHADNLPTGTRIGNYSITGRIGRGGMGVVYEAENTILRRKVAIKVMPDALAKDPDALRRFQREARAAAQIDHPNVVGIYDIGEWEGAYFIAMPLVRGGSVQALLSAGGPLHWRQATEVAADVCRGLAAAHAAGVVHRDIKPDNILIGTDGVVRIVDFGLAQAVASNDSLSSSSDGQGIVAGTLHYMSPEQCQGQRVGPASDIYSLGAAYHAMLVGKPPYEGDSKRILWGHCFCSPPHAHSLNATVPEVCTEIIRRAMAREPMSRFESVERMLGDLERALFEESPVNVAS